MSTSCNGKSKRKTTSLRSQSPDTKKSRLHSEGDALNCTHSFKDFICPICLEILIEPVVLPCKHELCLACFNPYLENASLCCPICRVRISVWARKNRKENTLVDEDQWNLIKKSFPDRVDRRMGIISDSVESPCDDDVPIRVLASDGEIRREYEEELKKIEKEIAENTETDEEYGKSLMEVELEAKRKLEEEDRLAAMNLQKEEMEKSGRPLRLPFEHRKKLGELFKKSPMKLRSCETTTNAFNSNQKRTQTEAEFSGRSCT